MSGGWIWLSDDEVADADECDCDLCLRISAEGVTDAPNA